MLIHSTHPLAAKMLATKGGLPLGLCVLIDSIKMKVVRYTAASIEKLTVQSLLGADMANLDQFLELREYDIDYLVMDDKDFDRVRGNPQISCDKLVPRSEFEKMFPPDQVSGDAELAEFLATERPVSLEYRRALTEVSARHAEGKGLIKDDKITELLKRFVGESRVWGDPIDTMAYHNVKQEVVIESLSPKVGPDDGLFRQLMPPKILLTVLAARNLQVLLNWVQDKTCYQNDVDEVSRPSDYELVASSKELFPATDFVKVQQVVELAQTHGCIERDQQFFHLTDKGVAFLEEARFAGWSVFGQPAERYTYGPLNRLQDSEGKLVDGRIPSKSTDLNSNWLRLVEGGEVSKMSGIHQDFIQQQLESPGKDELLEAISTIEDRYGKTNKD